MSNNTIEVIWYFLCHIILGQNYIIKVTIEGIIFWLFISILLAVTLFILRFFALPLFSCFAETVIVFSQILLYLVSKIQKSASDWAHSTDKKLSVMGLKIIEAREKNKGIKKKVNFRKIILSRRWFFLPIILTLLLVLPHFFSQYLNEPYSSATQILCRIFENVEETMTKGSGEYPELVNKNVATTQTTELEDFAVAATEPIVLKKVIRIIKGNSANIRDNHNASNSEVIIVVSDQDSITYLGEYFVSPSQSIWLKVETDSGEVGWISSKLIVPEDLVNIGVSQ